jgi:hypothetical protein
MKYLKEKIMYQNITIIKIKYYQKLKNQHLSI